MQGVKHSLEDYYLHGSIVNKIIFSNILHACFENSFWIQFWIISVQFTA
jgi:hypothetical protein